MEYYKIRIDHYYFFSEEVPIYYRKYIVVKNPN